MSASNLTAAVLARARQTGSRPSIRFVQDGALHTLTGDQVAATVSALILGLEQLSLPAGARVGILSRNRWEWILVDLAVAGQGLASVAIDPLWSDDLMVRILEQIGVQCLFVETAADAARIGGLRHRLGALRSLVVIDSEGPPVSARRLGDLIEAGCGQPDPRRLSELLAAVHPEDVATILFTGGSTGQPKGVIRTQRNLLAPGGAWFPWMGDELAPDPAPGDLLMDPLSFCHSAGRWGYQTALVRGAMLALPGPGPLSLRDFQRLSPTQVLAVPRLVLAWQKQLLPRLHGAVAPAERAARIRAALGGRLRTIACGGATLAFDLIDFFQRAGIEVRLAYGSTEAGIVAIHPVDSGRGLGRPTGVEVRIDGGEILVRGDSVSPGYLDNPLATAVARGLDGWWRTGDAGRLDAGLCLSITGRVRAMFNCNEGTNIDPLAIEHLLESDPSIQQAVIVGHCRPYLAALVVPVPEVRARPDGERLLLERLTLINERLEPFEQIRRLELVDGARMARVRSVTAAQKVQVDREAVDRVFAPEIARLYGAATAPITR
jgi:long-chain acyl-CoA synthetase